MELTAKLKMNDLFEEIDVLFCASLIDQEHENGLPYSAPLPKGMKIRMQWQRYIDYFQEWAFDPFMRKNGEVVVSDLVTGKLAYRMKFKNALCGDFKIVMDKYSSLGFYYDIWISYKLEDIDLLQEAEPMKKVVREYKNDTPKPEVIETSWLDENGKNIKKPKRNQKIFLEVTTIGMKGKKINVDLSDDDVDYQYQGAHVENDLLENITVTGDVMKLPLVTVKQRQ